MADDHGFEYLAENGRALLRCTDCGTTGEPWEWPLARRYQHARAHAGHPLEATAEKRLVETRAALVEQTPPAPRRDRHVVLSPRRCANPFCSVVFQPRRASARYCSGRCRVAVHRARAGGE